MNNPVITPDGISYERDVLKLHFNKNGNSDPLTKRQVTFNEVIENTMLKKAIENWIEELILVYFVIVFDRNPLSVYIN